MRDRARLVDALLRAGLEAARGRAGRRPGAGRRRRLRARRAASLLGHRRLHPAAEERCREAARRASSAFSPSSGTSGSRSVTACARSTTASARALADVSVATTLIEARLLAGPDEICSQAMRGARAGARVEPAGSSSRRRSPSRRRGTTATTTRPTTSSRTSRRVPAACATSRPSAGSRSVTSAPTRSTSSSAHGFLTAQRAAQAPGGAGVPVEGALRAARADRPPRGPPAVRSPDPLAKTVRLRGRDLHARGRAVHAALLPHGHGREPAERDAAAALPRGDPDRQPTQRARAAQSRASRSATTISKSRARRRVRAAALPRCWSCSGLMQQNPQLRGVRASTIRAVGRNLWLIDEEFRQNPRHHRLFLDDPARARRRDARAAAHEPVRRARPLHPGVRPHRRPHAVRPVPRLHRRCAHAVRGEQPAPPRDGEATITSSRRSRASCRRCRSSRSPTSPRCSTTSPRAAAAITRSSARSMPRRSASSRACRATTRASSPGWCATICCCRSRRRRRTSAIRRSSRSSRARSATRRTSTISMLLTVADVRGTNPKLWNSWKASLFEEFYERVKRALRRGLEAPIDQEELVRRHAKPRVRSCSSAACRRSDRSPVGHLHRHLFPAAHA